MIYDLTTVPRLMRIVIWRNLERLCRRYSRYCTNTNCSLIRKGHRIRKNPGGVTDGGKEGKKVKEGKDDTRFPRQVGKTKATNPVLKMENGRTVAWLRGRPIKEDNKSSEKDMSEHDSGAVSRPIIHWLKPDSKQLMRSAYRRVRGDHSRWTGIIIRQRLAIGETSVGVAR